MPVSSSAGPVVGRRANLEHRQTLEQLGTHPQHAAVRSVPLVWRRDQSIATERGDVDRAMRCEVHGVDVDVGADRVRGLDDRRQIGCRAEQVRRSGNGDPLGALVDQLDHVAGRQLPGRRIERRQHVLGAGSVGRPSPWRDVGVVVEPGADDPIARAKRRRRLPATRRTSATSCWARS